MRTRHFARHLILMFGLMSLLSFPAQAQNVAQLRAELQEIRLEIADTRSAAEAQADPVARDTLGQRLAVLQLSELLLQNQIYAHDRGIDLALTLPAVQPDPARAEEIRTEIFQSEERINDAVARASVARGEALELALQRVEAEKLAATYLRLAYYQARFGIYVPTPLIDGTGSASGPTTSTTTHPWADPRYPHVDYSHPLFRMSYNDGARISGWWVISTDGTSYRPGGNVFAQNLSQSDARGGANRLNSRLYVQCEDGVASLTFHFPDKYLSGEVAAGDTRVTFEVSYRIDNADLRRERWNSVVAGQGAKISGFEAIKIIIQLYGAESLFLQIREVDGTRHDARFQLAGIEDVVDMVSEACKWHSLDLAREDYRLLQTLLNIMGFDAGVEDGIWGRRSRQAMMDYQRSVGLPATGNPDIATLELLGLAE